MLVTVGNKTWQCGALTASQLIKVAKEQFKGKHAIVALEKGNTLEMRKDTFTNRTTMLKQVAKYMEKGFTVHIVG